MTGLDRAASLAEGAIVGGFRVIRLIGEGGFGAVYAGEEPRIKKRVAIKVLSRGADPSAIARFEREARAVNEIKHPGIIDVFAFGELDDGRPYLVMSLLEGRSLGAEIRARGRIPPREAWALARQAADALAAAHEAGVVHRDVKPDNVFVEAASASGAGADSPPCARVKLLDFGLAKLDGDAKADAPRLTRSGAMMGTPAYTAPEQWWNVGVDAKTDQYAFGATLFEMLVGRPPFVGSQLLELAQQHLHAEPPSLSAEEPSVTPMMDALVRRALAKAPSDRFASMRALIEEGDRAFAGASSRGAYTPATAGASSSSEAASPVDPMSSTVMSSPPIGVSVAAESVGASSVAPRVIAAHVVILSVGAACALALGYTGYARHDPAEWARIAGPLSLICVALFAIGAVASPILALARPSEPSLWRWWLAILPAFFGSLATKGGFDTVSSRVREWPETVRLQSFYVGMFEANAARFIGFCCATLLCLSLAALAAPSALSLRLSRGAPLPLARAPRGTITSACAFALLSAGAIAARAPSGAFIAAIAAGAVAIDVFLPLSIADAPPRASSMRARVEVERSIAALFAVIFAVAIGYARLVAREAVLWNEQPTRADRIREIIAADGERTATLAIAVAAIAALAVRAYAPIRRGERAGAGAAPSSPRRLGAGVVALAAAAFAFAALDVAVNLLFLRTRDELRASLAPRFSLFARLDPPLAPLALDPARFAPHAATAIQITQDAIAINAAFVAKLRALDSEEGAMNIGRDLNHALAAAPVTDAGAPEIALSVDRSVTYGSILRALRVVSSAGVVRAEILLTRGRAPALPPGAPAEAAFVLARDFIAIPIEITKSGFRAEETAPFGRVADELAALAARDPDRPVPVAAP